MANPHIQQPATHPYPTLRLGIVGGGQLARMMIAETTRLGITVTVLDPSADAPAAGLADSLIATALNDPDGLRKLVSQSDVTTYDIEHTNTAVLRTLEAAGSRIYPSPQLLEIIQDKYIQKQFLAEKGIPVPRFAEADQPSAATMQAFGLPLVQKSRRDGYDGRGVSLIRDEGDFPAMIPAPSILEACVDIDKELSVLVARSHSGEMRCYPVVEMVVDMAHNILDYLLAPARVTSAIADQARQIAQNAVECLDGVGIFAVEMFLTRDRELLVNEIAPRPHNSGHFTIEACITSQFQQHVRAVCGLPLGSTEQFQPAVMINLLGEPGFSGAPVIEGLAAALAIPGVNCHFYGKAQTRPYRKMGHVTIIAETLEEALDKATQVRKHLKIKARG